MVEQSTDKYDIGIIGSGIAGSTLAALLARQEFKVLVIEAGIHPKFAIGESMILETSEVLRAMAELYDVPEIGYFSSEHYFQFIGTSHGVKRHFSYLHHTPNQLHEPRKSLQAVIPRQPHGHELHLYRQDADYYLTSVAVSYGATVLQNTRVSDVEIGDENVRIQCSDGRTYSVNYIVDAGGFRSPLADKFHLRTTDLLTHSRALFTHMIDVPSYHQVEAADQVYDLPYSVAEGTLHHVFTGGWLWVIPFNNHSAATNPLCSVGLLLDPRIYPQRDDLSPEEEFRAVINQFPSVRPQFERARAVRPWVRTGRIQYTSTRVVGDRFALLGHAAGFIDPLYSKGLYSSFMSVSLLTHLLLDARNRQDYSAAHFRPLEQQTLAYIHANDRLIANSYHSFGNYKLWSVYSVLWLLGAYTELVKLSSARAQAQNRDEYYASLSCLRLVGGGYPEFECLADQIDSIVEATDPADNTAVDRAVEEIKGLFAGIDWMPQAFADVLEGKTFLPVRKLRPGLLRPDKGFMGTGDYRQHFFGDANVLQLVQTFLKEKMRYSQPSLLLRKRAGWRKRGTIR